MPTVSLRLVIGLVIVVVATVTAVVAFVPTYLTGQSSVRENVRSIRVATVRNIGLQVQEYFARAAPILHGIRNSVKRGLIPPDHPPTMLHAVIDAAIEMPPSSARVVYWGLEDETLAVTEIWERPDVYFHYGGVRNGTDTLILGNVSTADNSLHPPWTPLPNFIIQMKTSGGWWRTVSHTRPHTVWTVASISPPTAIRMYLAVSIFDPAGRFTGVTCAPVDADYLSDILRDAGLTPRSRAMIYEEHTGHALGISWGDSPVWDTGIETPDNFLQQKIILLRDINNFTDPLVNDVYHGIGRDALLTRTTPFAEEVGSGRGKVFVDVSHIRDAYGLRLRNVVAMPEKDFMEDIYEQQTKTIVGVVFAVLGLCLIAVGMTYAMLSALNRISERMALSAQLADDEANDPPSSISEVNAMQQSYEAMRAELNRVKVFLPSAVIVDQDEEEEEAPLPNISFTDRSAMKEMDMLSVSSSNKSASTKQSTGIRSRQSSDRKRSYGPNGAPVGKVLNTSAGLQHRMVTVLFLNLRGFHAMMGDLDSKGIQKAHRAVVDAVHSAVTLHRGVIDFFNGDHFACTFNATRPVAQHPQAAAGTVLQLMATLRSADATVPLTSLSCGIATGRATVGNLGNDAMQRFCTLGAVFSQAVFLERLARETYNVAVLMGPETTREIQLSVYYEHVDIRALPGNHKERLISTFAAARGATDEEWMYQIEESEQSDPYAKVNRAFELLYAGQTNKAKDAVRELLGGDLGTSTAADATTVGSMNGPSSAEVTQDEEVAQPNVIKEPRQSAPPPKYAPDEGFTGLRYLRQRVGL